ncbi:hypothetical protein HJC10_25595 [Corallococcus exiguus]|uniref:hypothetical protein n=1 Tax=Corallococcus TaxID=83461 RepID=UPI000ED47922|nr:MULTISPECIES: hypothetical protein [Corallococcus]NNB89571.1 hypothetical protein [Corallococcus exiguus]NNB96870.1 hypothetical protein [Corallococcus exiguus]NNC06211.1 hypothetical protein [Corallococcus exiguus]NPC49826.1 hypothetical protein [Corallococcus exiguus]RKH77807.1 hypothetical protein D7X99_30320 [Corallococcus sp. AB032C]
MKKLIGVFASVALLGSGVAFAQDSTTQQGSQQPSTSSGSMQGNSESTGSSDAMGGSGSSATHSMGSSSMTGANELTGKVVKSDSKKVYISSASGAVVPLDIDSKTQFTDPSVKNAKSLKEGQEIRASFQVKDEKNMATSISPSSGTGGSGSDTMAPDSSINEGKGGSGVDDQNKGMGNDSTKNPDTGSSSSPKTY